jgi:hypothetical protein
VLVLTLFNLSIVWKIYFCYKSHVFICFIINILTFEYIYKRQNIATFKKSELNELVGGDVTSSGGDRNIVNNSEIETGPVDKQWGDDSYYEKGQSTTTDKVLNYRQNIPWFAVYSFWWFS